MTASLAITLIVLGLAGGFFSGWLGIGGGIIMAPLLLYVPASLGTGNLDMRVVAGLTMVQSLFATGSGVVVHRRFQNVDRGLVLWMGTSISLATLSGALFSDLVPTRVLLGIFAVMAAVAAAMMLLPLPEIADGGPGRARQPLLIRSALYAVPIGLIGGLVGQSGAFIIIPVMLYLLLIPTRTTIGSSLGIVFMAAAAGSAGKIVTGQVEFIMALFCIAGALVGAQVGGYLSQRTRTSHIRQALAMLIAASAVRMALDLAGILT